MRCVVSPASLKIIILNIFLNFETNEYYYCNVRYCVIEIMMILLALTMNFIKFVICIIKYKCSYLYITP